MNRRGKPFLRLFLLVLIINSFLMISTNTSTIITGLSIKPDYGGSLVESTFVDIQMMNPLISSDSASAKVEDLLFESLLVLDKNLKYIPHMVKSWTVSHNNLDYTLNLHNDIYWHDGEQFTADDVIFTWERLWESQTSTYVFDDYKEFFNPTTEYITKEDDFTVIFHFKSVRIDNLDAFLLPIIPQHAFDNYLGPDGIAFTDDDCRLPNGTYTFNDDPFNTASGGKIPIGTGSMMFGNWYKGQNITLITNSPENGGPGYWKDHNAYLDRYVLKIILDIHDQERALRTGSIHLLSAASLPNENIYNLKANSSFAVYKAPTYTYDHFAFQCDPRKGNLYGREERDFKQRPNYLAGFEWQAKEYPWLDITGYLVRKALNYALDKQKIIEVAYPFGYRQKGPIYRALRWYKEDLNPYSPDLQKANMLLDQAGFGATVNDPKRKLLNFTLSYNQGGIRRQLECQEAKRQWESNLGILIDIEQLEWVSMLSTHYDHRNFDIINGGWTGGVGSRGYPDLRDIWSSKSIRLESKPIGIDASGAWIWEDEGGRPGGLNYMSYWNPEPDQLMEVIQENSDLSTTHDYYNQLQETIVADSPYVWVLAHANMHVANSSYHGFVEDCPESLWPEPVGFRNIYLHTKVDFSGAVPPPTFPVFEITTIFLGLGGLGLLLYLLYSISSQNWGKRKPVKTITRSRLGD